MGCFSYNPVCFPNYESSILSVTTSILKHYGVPTPYASLPVLEKALAKKYKNVVLMIFDGLGTDLLKQTLPVGAFLRRRMKQSISSVFPPTTTAATTTFYTGTPPIVHGWLAWACYFKEYGRVLELFTNRDFYTQQLFENGRADALLQYEHIFEKIRKVNGDKVRLREIFPHFKPNGVQNVQELCRRVVDFSKEPEPQFILSYWTEPDHTSHQDSPDAPSVRQIVADINKTVRDMCRELTDTLVIISADHGHLPIESAVYINDCDGIEDCLALPLSMDDRVVSVFLKAGKKEKFVSLFERYLASDFILMPREKIFETGLFGYGTPNPKALDFLGDFLIISKSYKSLRQRVGASVESDLKGAHSGLTYREMHVPLIMIEKSEKN